MRHGGRGDAANKSGGGHPADVVASSEVTAAQRTAKARAHAVQFFMQDGDTDWAAMLPDDPAQRISLHRQLRGRYNPRQVPLSSLSCAAYISAADVALLANLFRQYSLFSCEVADPLEGDAANAKGALTTTRMTTTTPTTLTATAAKPKNRRQSPTLARKAVTTPVSASTQANDPNIIPDFIQGKTGMSLLRRILEPPNLPVGSPEEGLLSPTSMTTAPSSTSVPGMFPGRTNAEDKVNMRSTTKATALVDRRELLEPFTSESTDAAITTGWLVELLMEIVTANSGESSAMGPTGGGGGVGGGGVVGSTALSSTKPRQASCVTLPQIQQGASNRLNRCRSFSISNWSGGNGGSVSSLLATAVYHSRRRDTRAEQLRQFRAELSTWAEHLSLPCDEHEHPAAWRQCATQEEVLQRYQTSLLQSQPPATHKASVAGLPTATAFNNISVSAAGQPLSRAKGIATSNFPLTHLASGGQTANVAFPRDGRSKVRWGSTDAAEYSPSTAAPSPTKCDAPRGTPLPEVNSAAVQDAEVTARSETLATSPTALGSASLTQRPRTTGAYWEGRDVVEILPFRHSQEFGVGTDDEALPPTCPAELAQSPLFSLVGSALVLQPSIAGTTMGAVSSPNASLTMLDATSGEKNGLFSLARKSMLTFKDLLQQPALLYTHLWLSERAAATATSTATAAATMAKEEEEDVRTAQPLHRTQSVRYLRQSLNRSEDGQHDNGSVVGGGPSENNSITRRGRAAKVQHLVCWSDVASNLLMGLETTWMSLRHETPYERVPTALLDDLAEMANENAGAPRGHGSSKRGGIGTGASLAVPVHPPAGKCDDNDDVDSQDEDGSCGDGADGNTSGITGQHRRRRVQKSNRSSETAALQQQAMLFSSLGAAAGTTLGSLHSRAADHIIAAPTQRYAVTSSKDGLLKVWDTTRGEFVSTILNIGQAWVLTMTFLHGGEYLLVATSAAEITVVNFPTGGVVLKLRGCTSLATAVPQIKQPSTVFTRRYGMRPGDCGRHKPTSSEAGGWFGAALGAHRMEYTEAENEMIVAHPILGYVTPSAAFYDAEVGFFFFGTQSGMVGCVDLSAVLSRTALHAAASGAGWTHPLQVRSSLLAHPAPADTSRDVGLKATTEEYSPSSAMAGVNSRSGSTGRRMTRGLSSFSAASGGASAMLGGNGGLNVNGIFYCGVGHCIISCDPDGGIVRTPFVAAADTLEYVMGTPMMVIIAAKPIRLMVCCPGGRRFVTVHSDRRAILWGVGRTLTECIHQYPQEAYDISDVCFMPPRQQIAMLMANHSIRIYDERGSRAITSIHPPRGLSSRAEDVATMTLKYSANDMDGCLTCLPTTQQLICGLRGPILYGPVAPSALRSNSAGAAAHRNRQSALDQQQEGEGKGTDLADVAPAGTFNETSCQLETKLRLPIAKSSSSESSLSLLPQPQSAFTLYGPSTPTMPIGPLTGKGDTLVSTGLPVEGTDDDSGGRDPLRFSPNTPSRKIDQENGEAQDPISEAKLARAAAVASLADENRLRCLHAALQRSHQRLQPHQTHSTTVIGLLLHPERKELHTFSTDSWSVWDYETGKRLRAPLHVPQAAERELAVRGRKVLLTKCNWSTDARSRVLVGTRDSRVLTLDARVSAVVSATDPFLQRNTGPSTGGKGPLLLIDKDVGAMATAGNRTLMCTGNICEVRRYDPVSAPQPSGEERYISMRVELPATSAMIASTTAAATVPSSAGAAATAASSPRRVKSAGSSAVAHTDNSSTITACCVVRESHLCLGTADTQLYFFRMVDQSSPVHMEVLRDSQGEPDVGRVVSLKYLGDANHDVLLAVVDTGTLYIYSYTMQRMLGRYSFPPLGACMKVNPAGNFSPRGHLRTIPPQAHYITSASLTHDSSSVSPTPSLMLGCGDSAGYVHLAPLTPILVELASSTSRDGAGGGTGSAGAPGAPLKTQELRVAASFRGSRSGIAALEMLYLGAARSAMTRSRSTQVAKSPLSDRRGSKWKDAAVASFITASPETPVTAVPQIIVFAGGFDGNVRLFSLTSFVAQMSDASPFQPSFAIPWSNTLTSPSAPPNAVLSPAVTSIQNSVGSPSVRIAGIPARTSFSRPFSTNSGGQYPLSPRSVGLPYEPTTIGVCGIDTWDLWNPNTFSDAEQRALMTRALDDGGMGVVLPSILDDSADQEEKKETAYERKRMFTNDPGVPGNDEAGGVVLLYDILRSSKKRVGSPFHSGGTMTTSASLLAQRNAPASAPVESTMLSRQQGGKSGTRSPVLTPPAAAQRKEVGGAAPKGSAGDAGVTVSRSVAAATHSPAACAIAAAAAPTGAPPPSPPPVPPPTHFTPHHIGELVPVRVSSTEGCLSDALSFADATEAQHVTDAAEHCAVTLSPIPPQLSKQNPLIRLYPVALLRHMGLLHPLDTTPDRDPETGSPVLISAYEAFKPWQELQRPSSQGKTCTSLVLSPSVESEGCGPLHVRSATADFLEFPLGTASEEGVESRRGSHPLSPALPASSSLEPSLTSDYRRPTLAASHRSFFGPNAVEVHPENDAGASTSHSYTRSLSEDAAQEGSVFITEGADLGKHRGRISSHTDALPSIHAAPQTDRPAGSKACEGIIDRPREEDTRQDCASPAAVESGRLNPLEMDGTITSHRSGPSINASGAPPWSTRSRQAAVPAAPQTPAQARAARKITYLSGVLANVEPEILHVRADQMMLAHFAGRLDRMHQVISPACRKRAAAAAIGEGRGPLPSFLAGTTAGVGPCTTRLMRLWRQRAGESAVTAAVDNYEAFEMAHCDSVTATATLGNSSNTAAGGGAEEGFSFSAGARRDVRADDKGTQIHQSLGSLPSKGLSTPRQRDPAAAAAAAPSGSVKGRRRSNGTPANPLVAFAARLQADPSTAFGVELCTMLIPVEPQLRGRRAAQGTALASDNLQSSTPAYAYPIRRGARTEPTATVGVSSSKSAPTKGTSTLPMIAVHQELQPIRVPLPSTMQADQSQQVWQRRFEAVFNNSRKTQKR